MCARDILDCKGILKKGEIIMLKKMDLFIGIYVLAAVIFMIVSIPAWLLDIFVALNIAISMIILFYDGFQDFA